MLRDTPRLTRILVLGEVRDRTPSKLQPIADALDVTVQAVSRYMRDLQAEGLVRDDAGSYVLTRDGVQALQEGIRELKLVVDDAARRFQSVDTTAAVAATDLQDGDRVTLVLREGVLHADPTAEGGSRGTVHRDAAAGEDVAVHDLEGVVDLDPGQVTLVRVPSVDRGGSSAVDHDALPTTLRDRGVDPHRVGVLGVEAHVLADRANLDPTLRLAPVAAAHHGATLGLDVLLLVSEDRLTDALAELDRLADDALEPVAVEILEPPEVPT